MSRMNSRKGKSLLGFATFLVLLVHVLAPLTFAGLPQAMIAIDHLA
jgi:hypothetical protein